MSNKITAGIIEKATSWLESETYCCHTLACAMSGEPFTSPRTSYMELKKAKEFLHPLLTRDGISSSGTWNDPFTGKPVNFSRETWLRKIAQELREGKISA